MNDEADEIDPQREATKFTDRDLGRHGYPGAVDGKLPPAENVPDGWLQAVVTPPARASAAG